MSQHPTSEPPIDGSLTHYMEERALAIALEKAADAGQRSRVEHLVALREVLMQQRDDFLREATASVMRAARSIPPPAWRPSMPWVPVGTAPGPAGPVAVLA